MNKEKVCISFAQKYKKSLNCFALKLQVLPCKAIPLGSIKCFDPKYQPCPSKKIFHLPDSGTKNSFRASKFEQNELSELNGSTEINSFTRSLTLLYPSSHFDKCSFNSFSVFMDSRLLIENPPSTNKFSPEEDDACDSVYFTGISR